MFSCFPKTIYQEHWSLKPDTVEALQRLQSWFRVGYFLRKEIHEILEQQEEEEQRLGSSVRLGLKPRGLPSISSGLVRLGPKLHYLNHCRSNFERQST